MQPKIEIIKAKKLIGLSLTMSFVNNRTGQLWQSFMPRRKEITNTLTTELISLQLYDPLHFQNFNPAKEFTKLACVEVSDFENIPQGMQSLMIPSSEYAIFHHKGSSEDITTFQYIFSQWLPNSDYHLDSRPHFEVLGEKYKNADSSSEEFIYVPVKSK
jgi:AraC family transcriptional regulator